MVKILGIHSGHDAGAAIIVDGRIVSAVNEERLRRQKLFWGPPFLAIKEVLRLSGLKPAEIDYIAISGLIKGGGVNPNFARNTFLKKMADYLSFFPPARSHWFKKVYLTILKRFRQEKELKRFLRQELGLSAPLKYIEHHYAHAASAYYCSPFQGLADQVLVLTVDSSGDGLSATVSVIEEEKIARRHATVFYHSPAVVYSYVTHNLGFKYGRHEGKITGLAAYGQPEKTIRIFRKIFSFRKDKLEFRIKLGCWGRPAAKRLHQKLQGYKREDIAAGLQKGLEELLAEFTAAACRRYNKSLLCLAGGLFANVKLNQVLFELKEVKDIYVHPHMGDGGQAVGAAMFLWSEKFSARPIYLPTVYLGPSFSKREIEQALKASQLKFKYFADIYPQIAKLLAQGRIVARFYGAMEYGPRALGHRSILYQTSDQTVNDWLNKKLNRTEFMPFAPIILREKAGQYFRNFDPKHCWAANFMTITYRVTGKCRQNSPAITHVDGTARPQVVDKENNFDSWRILQEYDKLTGKPILINTSFNMHEEPIVSSPEEAIKSFLSSRLDILAIGNYIAQR